MIGFHGAKINWRCEAGVTKVLQSCYNPKNLGTRCTKSPHRAVKQDAGMGYAEEKDRFRNEMQTYSCGFMMRVMALPSLSTLRANLAISAEEILFKRAS